MKDDVFRCFPVDDFSTGANLVIPFEAAAGTPSRLIRSRRLNEASRFSREGERNQR
jgi:hypothetical protein